MIRGKQDITAVLDVTNQQILKENLGFTKTDIALAHSIWNKLSNRRLNRGAK